MNCSVVFASWFLLLMMISPFSLKPSHGLKVYIGNFFTDAKKAQIQLVCISNEGANYEEKRLLKTRVNHGEHAHYSVADFRTRTKHKCEYAWADDEAQAEYYSPMFLVFNGEWRQDTSVFDSSNQEFTYVWYFEDRDQTKLYNYQTKVALYRDIVLKL